MKSRTRSGRIAYIDLFAGPGRYKDGTKSTPLLILEKALSIDEMPDMLVTMFNDKDDDHVQSLKQAISLIPNINSFKYRPKVHNNEVGDKIVKMFEKMAIIPTFFFVDPWGYKGLSLRLINSVLKDWGCDCVFFFNYTRINMGVGNTNVEEHINALFGSDRADSLRNVLANLRPQEREDSIVNELALAIKDYGTRFVLPFRFKNEKGKRTSHHLFFVSKNVLGYNIMKNIMAGYSSSHDQGVPSFEYNPVDNPNLKLLFSLARPLDQLSNELLEDFSGQTLTVGQIFDNHHIDKPYILKNYKSTLISLEKEGKIKADPPAEKRRKIKGEVTMADRVKIVFPIRN
jgi:three-Cys-motif partner protein